MPPNTANLRGAWAVGTTYNASDEVAYDGFLYECLATCTGVSPAGDNGTYWTIVASEGAIPDNRQPQDIILTESTYAAQYGDTIFATVNCTITLPAPAEGQLDIKVISDGASITATVAAPTGSTVNGTTSVTVTTEYTKKSFVSDGFNWYGA